MTVNKMSTSLELAFLLITCVVTCVSAVPDIELVYHDYEALSQTLTDLTEKYPDHTDLYSIGESVEGRQLWVLAIAGSNPGSHETLRPEVKYIGNMHGNEVIGREMLLHFAEELLRQYSTNNDVRRFLDETRVHIMPTLNPDGFEASYEGNCTDVIGRYNANGRDINRDFPDYFEPDEEPRQAETQAVMDWLKTEQFVLSANLHGGVLVANYPYDNMAQDALAEYWNVLGDPAPYSASTDDDILRFLALVYSYNHRTMWNITVNKCGSDHPESGFLDGVTNGADWYAVKGGMQDYNYFEAGCFETTLEISCCKYPRESELGDFWDQNANALYEYLRQVHRGVKGLVTDEGGMPIGGATVKIDDRLVGHTTTDQGEYWYILLPGDYQVQVSKDGYKTETKTGSVGGGLYNTDTVNFALQENGVAAIVPSLPVLLLVYITQRMI